MSGLFFAGDVGCGQPKAVLTGNAAPYNEHAPVLPKLRQNAFALQKDLWYTDSK
ncbi:MAG: hypothetical protein FWE08_00950 [Oscillospiraceae bacterium]|nr:hypothetical protein [Oscillospiraceae bacterium]